MNRLKPEMMLNDGLLQALAALFGMDRLYGGEGVRRDERGWIMRDDQGRKVLQPVARSLWVAEICPAHIETACIAVATIEDRRLAGFVIETRPWFAEYPPEIMPIVPPTIVGYGPVQPDPLWKDPVPAALGRLEEWPRDQFWAIDGRRYAIFAGTSGSQIALTFANPIIPALQTLEDSLVQVAQMLSIHDPTGELVGYLARWTPYTQIGR